MVSHPIRTILANSIDPNKALLRPEIEQYPREFTDVATFRTYDLPGVPNAIIAGRLWRFDALDLATADDGVSCVHDASARRYKLTIDWQRKVLAADVTNNNGVANTIADITGLSFPVVNGRVAAFKFVINYTAALVTTGARFAINGPAKTALYLRSEYPLDATSLTFNNTDAYDTPAAANASSLLVGNRAVIEGEILPSANGTVIARFASEVAGSAIVAKALVSYVDWKIIQP